MIVMKLMFNYYEDVERCDMESTVYVEHSGDLIKCEGQYVPERYINFMKYIENLVKEINSRICRMTGNTITAYGIDCGSIEIDIEIELDEFTMKKIKSIKDDLYKLRFTRKPIEVIRIEVYAFNYGECDPNYKLCEIEAKPNRENEKVTLNEWVDKFLKSEKYTQYMDAITYEELDDDTCEDDFFEVDNFDDNYFLEY